MAKKLVIVESPTKADTINRYLGKDFKVLASYGHVRDLPKFKLGIDVDTFEISYTVPKKAKVVIKALKEAAKGMDQVLLATDGDREGEAIAWHISQLLGLDESKPNRLKFFEITKDAITESIKHPLLLDQKLVDAQQARRVLDRLVGYKLSPILWHKVRKGLSAGRVQSVALFLVVEREKEIRVFKIDIFFVVSGVFNTKNNETFTAELTTYDDKKLGKLDINTETLVEEIKNSFKDKPAVIKEVDKKISFRSPGPPFITSSLQQEASNTLGYSPKKTMVVAQQLYEGVKIDGEQHGLITYMRTDSHHLSEQAVGKIRDYIKESMGENQLSPEVRRYTKKVKMSQEAHEAIRPTNVFWTPEKIKPHLSGEQLKVYRLIWNRAVATQIKNAEVEVTKIKVVVDKGVFEAKGEIVIDPGYYQIYGNKMEKAEFLKAIPSEGEQLKVVEYKSEQKSTEPPPRYSAASLIKALEEKGIGRPSTYAPTISTLTDRGYIQIEEKKLVPSEIADIVIDLLAKNFPFVVDTGFTAKMEEELDMIANGELQFKPFIKEFYGPFEKEVEEKENTIEKIELPVKETNEKCPECGAPMVIKLGRFGEFIACTRFPECKGTLSIQKHIGVKCPKDSGEIIERKTKKKRIFYGCSNYPKCDFASWQKPVDKKCPECGSMLTESKKGQYICLENKHVVSDN